MEFKNKLSDLRKRIDIEINLFFDEILKNKSGFTKDLLKLVQAYSATGGKRLRPIYLISAFEKVTNSITPEIIKASICVELYHASTLIHDDIMDEDEKRRGNDTIYETMRKKFVNEYKNEKLSSKLFVDKSSRYSISQGMLAGNILSALATKPLSDSNFLDNRKVIAIKTLLNCSVNVNIGQIHDINSEHNKPTEKDYISMVNGKTVDLFVASTLIGLILAGETNTENYLQYAKKTALAFQIQDDIMDISKDSKKGHKLGSDILQGKNTMLMIKTFEICSDEEKKLINNIFGNEKSTDEQIEQVINIIHSCGALDYVNTVKEELINQAKISLNDPFFNDLADYMISRNI